MLRRRAILGITLISLDKNFLRYLRYNVTTVAGGSVTFSIRGMGRRYGA